MIDNNLVHSSINNAYMLLATKGAKKELSKSIHTFLIEGIKSPSVARTYEAEAFKTIKQQMYKKNASKSKNEYWEIFYNTYIATFKNIKNISGFVLRDLGAEYDAVNINLSKAFKTEFKTLYPKSKDIREKFIIFISTNYENEKQYQAEKRLASRLERIALIKAIKPQKQPSSMQNI